MTYATRQNPRMIEKTSALYLRRLASEIRQSFAHGVYYAARRVQSVQCLRAGNSDVFRLWVKLDGNSVSVAVTDVDGFSDGYGREICASRQP